MEKLLPTGEYRVIFDGEVLGKFNSLAEAQRFQSTLGKRGSQIIPPNLRKQLPSDQIRTLDFEAENFGKTTAERLFGRK